MKASLVMTAFVILGAFGAHGLESRLDAGMMKVYHTAVFYHAVHGLALLALVCLADRVQADALVWPGRFFTAGLVLFCGSLYVLAVTGIKKLGMITPFGGLAFIAGWISLAFVKFK